MKRKIFLLICAALIAALLIGVLAACDPGSKEQGGSQTPGGTTTPGDDGLGGDVDSVVTSPDGIVFTNIGGSYSVTGYEGTDTKVVIPETYEGLPVTSIGGAAFAWCTSLTSVTIPDSVTSIGEDAFAWCTSLTSVAIGNGVTSIGWGAFSGCDSLTSITIPDSVTSIGSDAFYDCDNLQYNEYGNALYLGNDENPYLVLIKAKDKSITSVDINASTRLIYNSAFSGCSSLISVTIPDSVISIGGGAFSGCTGIIETVDHVHYVDNWVIGYDSSYDGRDFDLVLRDGTRGLADGAFSSSQSPRIKSVIIPDSVVSIGNEVFSEYCYRLASVTIGRGVVRIGEGVFTGCDALESLIVAEGNPVYHSAGNCVIETATKTLVVGCNGSVIPDDDSVTSIGEYAFEDCRALSSIVIPDGVTSIGDGAFYYCTALASVNIPKSVKRIGESAFEHCAALTSVTIPDSVTYIGDGAFLECLSLASINIPKSVKIIGAMTFLYCTSLTSITIPDSVISIGGAAFTYCESLTSITIPDSVTSIAYGAFAGCVSLETLTVDKRNPVYHSAGNCIIETATGTLVQGCNNSVIPDDGSVTSIGDGAFLYCDSLTSIAIPDSVTSIGEHAFSNCTSLASITIPDSVTRIEDYAFIGCYKLVEVYNKSSLEITAGSSDHGEVARYAKHVYTEEGGSWLSDTEDGFCFLYDGETGYLVAYLGNETELTLPESFTAYDGTVVSEYQINDYAFEDCDSLTSVTIPDSVTSVGSYAFSGCNNIASATMPAHAIGDIPKSNIKTVVITSGENIGDGAFRYCTSLTSVIIPDSVTSIGNSAFYGCTSLTSITIPDSVTSIGNYAFEDCNKLIEVHNKSSLEITAGSTANGYVARYAKHVYTKEGGSWFTDIDDGLRFFWDGKIGYLVAYLGNETELTLPDSFTAYNGTEVTSYQIYDYAFYRRNDLTSVTIPNGVTSIGDSAFAWCTSLTSIVIPDSVTSIGTYAFEDCAAEIIWGDTPTITEIGEYAFAYYDGTSITIPDGVTSIGECAFSGCTSLISITIPDGVTSIEERAFENCTSLTSVTIGNSVTSIGAYAFLYCDALTSITIPDSVSSIGEATFVGCDSLEKLIVASGNPVYHSEGNCIIETATGILVQGCNNSIIPSDGSVTSIGGHAFSGCTSLTSVTIPDSVTSIGERAFQSCGSLTSVTIPDSVTSIGDSAFGECTSLTSVTIPDSVTSIGEYVFYGCTSLTSITIPDSVTSIGDSAFEDCDSLTSVTFDGKVEQWNAIDKGWRWNDYSPFKEVKCSDGNVSV